MPKNLNTKSVFFKILILLTLVLTGCSTRFSDYDFYPIYRNVRFLDADTEELFSKVHRFGFLYQDYRPVLVADVIFKGADYRKLYANNIVEGYGLRQKQSDDILREQRKSYHNRFEFVLFLYNGSLDNIDLHKAKSQWKLYLQDDDGDELLPMEVRKLKHDAPEAIFLKKYMIELDRWVEVYLVSFPKLAKAVLQEESGTKDFQMTLTSLNGRILLEWKQSQLFYSKF